MTKKDFTRRDFHALSAAALGGMLSAGIGCSQAKSPEDRDAGAHASAGDDEQTTQVAKHACRGLNECKGQGAKGTNECAGAGTCATVEPHACAGQNECKGLGGCGQKPGDNECKGQGGCQVPMTGGMWERAREAFEQRMEAKGVEVLPAPEPAA